MTSNSKIEFSVKVSNSFTSWIAVGFFMCFSHRHGTSIYATILINIFKINNNGKKNLSFIRHLLFVKHCYSDIYNFI